MEVDVIEDYVDWVPTGQYRDGGGDGNGNKFK